MRIDGLALFALLACISCKEYEKLPVYTIAGTYHATKYDPHDRQYPYPVSGHTLTVKIVQIADSTVNVEIVSTPPDSALPERVFIPPSKVYKNVPIIINQEQGTGRKNYYLNLEPIFGHPEEYHHGFFFYPNNIADYIYSPSEAPNVPRIIRIKREDL